MNRRQFQHWLGLGSLATTSLFLSQCRPQPLPEPSPSTPAPPSPPEPETQLLIPTFLGNDQRCYYGSGIPQALKLQRKFLLGTGQTRIGSQYRTWSGAGWTGQPTLVKDRGEMYLMIGAYDHSLRKLRLRDFHQVWRYRFEDVIKGTATIYLDPQAPADDQIVIVQGSRMGLNRSLSSAAVPSLRAISFRTGQELWQMNIPPTDSYSRDHDGSPLWLADRNLLFTGAENGIGYFLSSQLANREKRQGLTQPQIIAQVQLYASTDKNRQGGNLVTESSPARWQNQIYIAAGAGHVYGIDLETKKINWDYLIGTDLDGSVVINQEGCLFCPIEKQYNPGLGGVLKLDPRQPPAKSVVWFLPTGNARVAQWEGGVIGSVSLNDTYNPQGKWPRLFAVTGLDGFLYLGSQDQLSKTKVSGPRQDGPYPQPKIAVKYPLVASISTPIFTEGERLIAAGYGGVYLFQISFTPTTATTPNALPNAQGDYFQVGLVQLDQFGQGISFEATPIVWDGNTYIAARDGYLYGLG